MSQGYRSRIGTALRLLAVREGGKPSQERLAERVGKRANRSYTQSAAKGWLKGVVPSDLDAQLALALELGVDPGWLYFHPHSKAPAPAGIELAGEATEQPPEPIAEREYRDGLPEADALRREEEERERIAFEKAHPHRRTGHRKPKPPLGGGEKRRGA